MALGVSGLMRHKAMGLKDQVIGISLLRSDGTMAQAGGRKRGRLRPAPAHRQLGQLGLDHPAHAAHPTTAQPPAVLCRGGALLLAAAAKTLLHSPLAPERLEWRHQAGEIRLWLSQSLNPEGLLQQQEQLKTSVAPELNLELLDWEPSPTVVDKGHGCSGLA